VGVETSHIYAELEATSYDGGTAIVSALLRRGPTYSGERVELEAGDTLTAATPGEAIPLVEAAPNGAPDYVGRLTNAPGGTAITFDFERSAGVSAPTSTVTLPGALEITSPEVATVFSRSADAITVVWEPPSPDDSVQITLSGECIYTDTQDMVSDTGWYTFPAGALDSGDSGFNPRAAPCDAQLTVRRIVSGELDLAFAEGVVTGVQKRTRSIRLDP